MPKVKVNDFNMYYEIHGEGEPLVLIPGMGANTATVQRFTSGISQYYRVVAIDNRGAGQSDKPNIPYTTKMMADDIAGLLEEISINKAHIVGASLGGMIAQEFVLSYPERVVNLVLGVTIPGGPHTVGWDELMDRGASQQNQTLTVEEGIRARLSLALTKEFIDDNPDFFEQLVELRLKNPPDPIGAAGQMQAFSSHDTYDRLPDIEVPTLVIAGDEDKTLNPENSRVIALRIPNSELVMLEKVGHALFIMAPDITTKIIVDFLKRNNP